MRKQFLRLRRDGALISIGQIVGLLATILVGIFLLPVVGKQGDIARFNNSSINLGVSDFPVVMVVLFAVGVVVVAIRAMQET